MMASGTGVSESKEDFGEKLNDMALKGFTALGVSFGVSTGLLAKMATFTGPKTSQAIADESSMKERYVREWLSIVVCGGIVDFDSTSQTFFLPHHRRPYFTSGCREEESSLLLRCVPMLASAFDNVNDCIKLDGPRGFPFSLFNYHPEMSRVRFQNNLIDELGTFAGLKEQLEAGIPVLDVACGVGISTCTMAKQFPNSRFIGLDIDGGVIDKANGEATNQKLGNIEFVCSSAMDMPADWSDKFDFLFLYNGIHDASRPDQMLREALRILKPGAKAMFHEPTARSNLADNAANPGAAIVYTFSTFRCLPTALDAEGALGLGAAWGKEKCQKMLQDTGFDVHSVGLAIDGKTWRFSCTKPLA